MTQNELPDYANPQLLQRHRLPARSYFVPYADVESALTFDRGQSDRLRSLSGRWKFHYADSPAAAPRDFFEESYDDAAWAELPVPSQWQKIGRAHV